MRRHGHRDHGDEDQRDREVEDRPELLGQLAKGSPGRGEVKEWRDEDEKNDLRLQGRPRQPRRQREPAPPSTRSAG